MEVMTIKRLASLSSGADAWHTRAVEELSMRGIVMSDGPHGVRKAYDASNLERSIPATAFPTAACIANSWDRNLLQRVGNAIAKECRALGVDLLLAPGLNIKRSPLGGRNFEYYSEDPLLSGELAAAFVDGVQQEGVGATVKHFTANNAEFRRMTLNTVVDERTLRELYLAGFERVIRRSKPYAVMAAYNRLNGTPCCENRWLLTTVLRDEWGYGGLVLSDWGAVEDRPRALRAGLDLQMPGPAPYHDQDLVAALSSKTDLTPDSDIGLESPVLPATGVRRSIEALRRLHNRLETESVTGHLSRSSQESIPQPLAASHHSLAREAAAAGIVLLHNRAGILPFQSSDISHLTVIGRLAAEPRFQGAGSSQMVPTELDSILEHAEKTYAHVSYYAGYEPEGPASAEAVCEAAQAVSRSDAVLLVVGLPDSYESEGFDRAGLSLPEGQHQLIRAVCNAQPNTAVAVVSGAPVDVRWEQEAGALLHAGLGGQAAGSALIDVVSGRTSPRGRLTETFPIRVEDTPCYLTFPGENDEARYGEGVFVGYRYYETTGTPVAFPFGHGESYGDFRYTEMIVTAQEDDPGSYRVRARIANVGHRRAVEVVQLYVAPPPAKVHRPRRELQAFTTVELDPGNSQEVELLLDARAFTYWDTSVGDWVAEPGEYELAIGASVADIRCRAHVSLPHRLGPNKPLDVYSSLAEWLSVPQARDYLRKLLPNEFHRILTEGEKPSDEMFRQFPLVKLLHFFPDSVTPERLKEIIKTVSGQTNT